MKISVKELKKLGAILKRDLGAQVEVVADDPGPALLKSMKPADTPTPPVGKSPPTRGAKKGKKETKAGQPKMVRYTFGDSGKAGTKTAIISKGKVIGSQG